MIRQSIPLRLFVPKSDASQFVSRDETGNFGGGNADLSDYVLKSETGDFVSQLELGNFVTQDQTGDFALKSYVDGLAATAGGGGVIHELSGTTVDWSLGDVQHLYSTGDLALVGFNNFQNGKTYKLFLISPNTSGSYTTPSAILPNGFFASSSSYTMPIVLSFIYINDIGYVTNSQPLFNTAFVNVAIVGNCTASGTYWASPTNVIDENTGTFANCSTDHGWNFLRIDFGSGNTRVIRKFLVRTLSQVQQESIATNQPTGHPFTSFKIDGLPQNGTPTTTLFTWSGTTTWETSYLFHMSNNTGYRYYQFVSLGSTNGTRKTGLTLFQLSE